MCKEKTLLRKICRRPSKSSTWRENVAIDILLNLFTVISLPRGLKIWANTAVPMVNLTTFKFWLIIHQSIRLDPTIMSILNFYSWSSFRVLYYTILNKLFSGGNQTQIMSSDSKISLNSSVQLNETRGIKTNRLLNNEKWKEVKFSNSVSLAQRYESSTFWPSGFLNDYSGWKKASIKIWSSDFKYE